MWLLRAFVAHFTIENYQNYYYQGGFFGKYLGKMFLNVSGYYLFWLSTIDQVPAK